MQLQQFVITVAVTIAAALLANAQSGPYPPRLSIPGASPVGGPVPYRPHLRSEKIVRVRRPVALRAQNSLVPVSAISARLTEDPKPVTELAEGDHLPDVFLPTLLREQQLAQSQQAQFHQTAAAFFNEPNAIPDSPSAGHFVHHQQQQPQQQQQQQQQQHEEETASPAPPPPPTRFAERPQPAQSAQPSSRPNFNDYGIGAGFGAGGGVQRYGGPAERPQAQAPAPVPQRGNVIRTRQPQRPQYEAQSAPAPAPVVHRSRPKPIQPRPLIDQNQLQDERDQAQQASRRQRPVAQTTRKWRDENEDGSITWGYENDDGSFKEELIGTDCVTKGTYGYIDPDGNKREYHYETGIKCDPNTRQTEQELQENGFINYEENKAVLPNGIEIDMSQLGKKKSRRPGTPYRN